MRDCRSAPSLTSPSGRSPDPSGPGSAGGTARRPQTALRRAAARGRAVLSGRGGLLLGTLLVASVILLTASVARADGEVETQLGDRLHAILGRSGAGFLWAYALAYAAGVATSLTPCVYPLIPITIGLFGARDAQTTRLAAMGLAACYVGGLAVTYTSLGIVVGLTGGGFGAYLNKAYVIVPLALFFVAMAASMFGAFELQLPSEAQGALSNVGGKGPIGAFLMGLVAGLIAAPCTGPPLAALLVFVGTQKSVFLGGSLLFVYALGIGLLFFVIAGFALKMPRSGPWMDVIKSLFGVIMLVAALYFLRNVVPPLRSYGRGDLTFLGMQGLLVALGLAVGGLQRTFHDGLTEAAKKAAGILLMTCGLFGVVAWLFAAPVQSQSQSQPPVQAQGKTGEGAKAAAAPAPVVWGADEAAGVAAAQRDGKPLIIDFGATWCVPCQQLEHQTFVDPRVLSELGRFVLVRVDASDADDRSKALQAKYGSTALPLVVLIDKKGKIVRRIQEFVSADHLLPILKQID